WGNPVARPVANARPISTASTAGCPATNPASRCACARNAACDFADNTHATTLSSDGGVAPPAGTVSPARAGSASSRIRWALVPEIPNEDTPARRGRPPAGHGVASANNATAPADQSTRDEGASTCNDFGNI